MSKATSLNGKDLMLWIGGKVVALSKSCDLQIQANIGDSNTKDDGLWDGGEVTSLNWNMSNESVDSADANRSNDQVFKDLFALMKAKSPVAVTFGIPSNQSDGGVPTAGWTAPSAGSYSGYAIITSLSRTGAKGSNASVSVSLQGTSELAGGSGN